jgi:hypothetical protein
MPKLLEVYNRLAPAKNNNVLAIANQSTNDIINQVLSQHSLNVVEAKKICDLFDAGNLYETCKNIWNFLKYQVPYKVEPSDRQTTKTLSRMLFDAINGKGNDCKHYAGFTGAVLQACGYTNWSYRFAGYSKYINVPTHVYCYAKDDDGIIYIDAVINGFDLEKPFVLKVDKKINNKNMSLYKLSGFDDNAEIGNWFTDGAKNLGKQFKKVTDFAGDKARQAANFVKKEAENVANKVADYTKTMGLAIPRNSFLLLIEFNVKGWATGLKNKTMNELKWWADIGGDRVKLVEAIKRGAKNKRILGFNDNDVLFPSSVGSIGEPISISAALATATPIIIKVTDLLSAAEKVAAKAEGIVDKGKGILDKGKDNLDKTKSTFQLAEEAAANFKNTTGIDVKNVLFKKEDGVTGDRNAINASDLKPTTPADAKRVADAMVQRATGVNPNKLDTKTMLLIGGGALALLLILKKK